MAQTRTAYALVDDSEIDAESPITESLMLRLRDQWFGALADAASAAPTADRVALPERAKTDNVTTTHFLRPDGSGGVVFGAIPAPTIPVPGLAAVGGHAFFRKISSSGGVSPGATLAGSQLHWSDSGGNLGASVGSGSWRCLGAMASASDATVWVRIS